MKNFLRKYAVTSLIILIGVVPTVLFTNATKLNIKPKLFTNATKLNIKYQTNKDIVLGDLWSRPDGAKKRLISSLTNVKSPFSDKIIYNSQLNSGPFLQHAFDTGNDKWIIELAETYEHAYNLLTETNIYSFNYPASDYQDWVDVNYLSQDGTTRTTRRATRQPAMVKKILGRQFKMWLNAPIESGSLVGHRLENTISSSQFIYPLTLIMHYAAKNGLVNHPVLSRFIDKFYPVVLQDHYLRWIFNDGIPVGTFQLRGWGCNGGSFSHEERIEHLRHKRFGTDFFIGYGSAINFKGYCNSYHDADGWIAFGLSHILAANKLNPNRFPVPILYANRIKSYLQKSLNLFSSRHEYSNWTTVEGEQKVISIFDKDGFQDHPDLKYTGYSGSTFPGWTSLVTKQVAIPNPSPAQNVGWDISHAYRFVHFYWSLKNTIKDLGLKFPIVKAQKAYANSLLYKVFDRTYGDERDFSAANVKLNNFMSGNNGWYRVNYLDRPDYGIAPFGLTKMGIVGGQAYFIKFNPDLLPGFIGLKEKYDFQTKPWGGDVLSKLNSYASLPEEVFL